jgi:ABC-type sugar transport system substrate-binding protein
MWSRIGTGGRAKRAMGLVAAVGLVAGGIAACGDDGSGGSGGSSANAQRSATDKKEAPYVATGPKGEFKLAPSIQAKLDKKQKLNITMSLQATTIPIFSGAMKAGFERGIAGVAKKWPVNGEIIGPKETDYPSQVSQITQLVDSNRVDCLVVHAAQPGPFVAVINKAMSKGIPVFGVNADSPESARFAFYTINEYEGGKLAGKIAGEQIKKRSLKVDKAALMTGDVSGPWAQDRMKGFVEGVKAVLPDLEFANDAKNAVPTTFEPPKTYAAVRSYVTGHPDVQLLFSTDQGVESIGKVISDLKKDGKVYAAGFNVSPAIIKDIEADRTVVSVAQAWNKQAESGATACAGFLLDGKVPTPPVQELPALPITKDNAAAVSKDVDSAA